MDGAGFADLAVGFTVAADPPPLVTGPASCTCRLHAELQYVSEKQHGLRSCREDAFANDRRGRRHGVRMLWSSVGPPGAVANTMNGVLRLGCDHGSRGRSALRLRGDDPVWWGSLVGNLEIAKVELRPPERPFLSIDAGWGAGVGEPEFAEPVLRPIFAWACVGHIDQESISCMVVVVGYPVSEWLPSNRLSDGSPWRVYSTITESQRRGMSSPQVHTLSDSFSESDCTVRISRICRQTDDNMIPALAILVSFLRTPMPPTNAVHAFLVNEPSDYCICL